MDINGIACVPENRKSVLHLKSPEQKRFIATHTAAGKTFFLIYDPRVAIAHLMGAGELTQQELFEINELYTDLSQKPVASSSSLVVTTPEIDAQSERPHV